MTDQGQPNTSAFNKRSDNAASLLKQAMKLPEAKVVVDANGQPPAAPPPEGSYARAAHDETVVAQAPTEQPEPAQHVEVQDDQPSPREQFTPEISEKAEARIQDLVGKLKDQELVRQQLEASNQQSETQIAELRQATEQLNAKHDELLAAQLETLSPEERAQYIGNHQINEAVQAAESRIMQQLQPTLSSLSEQALAKEFETVAAKYPDGFDPRVHPELINHFRQQNPNCSVEMAFKAVATLEEMGVGNSRPANPVPPSLAPTHSGIPKSIPLAQVSHPQSDPQAEIAEEAQQAYQLMRSKSPADNKAGIRAIDANLTKRLFGTD